MAIAAWGTLAAAAAAASAQTRRGAVGSKLASAQVRPLGRSNASRPLMGRPDWCSRSRRRHRSRLYNAIRTRLKSRRAGGGLSAGSLRTDYFGAANLYGRQTPANRLVCALMLGRETEKAADLGASKVAPGSRGGRATLCP